MLMLDGMQMGEDPSVRTLSLRILREILKTEHMRLAESFEVTTLRVLTAFIDPDATVSQQ